MDLNSAFRQRCDTDILTADGSEDLVHVCEALACACTLSRTVRDSQYALSVHDAGQRSVTPVTALDRLT